MRYLIVIGLLTLWIFQSCQQKEEAIDLSDLGIDYKPNILWLSTEDIGCYLAAYGDSTVHTPHLDRLAAEGIVFEHAFATAGACAPSRFSIISGIHPASTAATNMRTWGRKLPDSNRYVTNYLMDAGYYCTNNSKTDYAFTEPAHETLWHETSIQAHYKNRPSGQPFFAVFNYTGTHESRFFDQEQELLVAPDQVPVPPYYPDNQVARRDLAINYSNIKRLDDWMGDKLEQLEHQGLLDSTIIFFWSDHGGPLPNQKREIYDRGTRVPLMVRLPGGKFAGRRIADLVSLMDLGPTTMSITGIPSPDYMQGKAFAGIYQQAPRQYIYTARDRIAPQYDVRRAVRDARFRYVRNFYPELPRYRHFNYRMNIGLMQDLMQKKQLEQLNQVQSLWFQETKPPEEFYDLQADPHEINNLIDDPQYTNEISRLRQELSLQMVASKDVGLIPEPMIFKLQDSLQMPMYSVVRNYHFPMQKIYQVATFAVKSSDDLHQMALNLNDTLSVVRYWAATRLGNHAADAEIFEPKLHRALQDDFPSVRIAAAYALHQMGHSKAAIASLIAELGNQELTARMFAAFQLSRIGSKAQAALPALQKLQHGHSYQQQAVENAIRAIKNE